MARLRRSGGAADGADPSADTAEKVTRAARKPLTPARAKRLIGVSKAVAPLLAPYTLALAGIARSRWDAHRATRLGVEPGQLAAYSRPGGALHARLSRMAEALDGLDGGTAAQRFAQDTRHRLANLAVAVRAAEQMPNSRRRTTYRAVGAELDHIEVALLTHLGVSP